MGISQNRTGTLGRSSVRNCGGNFSEELPTLFFSDAQNISTSFLLLGQRAELGAPRGWEDFGEPQDHSEVGHHYQSGEGCTNGVVPCSWGQTPPDLLVWSRTFLSALPLPGINLSQDRRSPQMSWEVLSRCCHVRRGLACFASFPFSGEKIFLTAVSRTEGNSIPSIDL